ncbi:hypothetical protein SAY87_021720 [Trapa incisa]|uniref:Uncharacterized protein n=1 Tax=Trapa incisa TaxID=236973 RepID=A0AAN7JTW6_9MYRT|nr:hypothetical protein SAY87_021720 [Trapa incisa]
MANFPYTQEFCTLAKEIWPKQDKAWVRPVETKCGEICWIDQTGEDAWRSNRPSRKQMELNLGVRKGAWTEEEDSILRKWIEKHGEGNWYQVPMRTGLNRCRKSCRLRWLNYLKPNIKRGSFKRTRSICWFDSTSFWVTGHQANKYQV